MLAADEARRVAVTFGVADEQVRRDHLISHLLAALSRHAQERVLFFGGTALSRAFLPDGRLSEDLDLVAVGNRRYVAADLEPQLIRGVRREYPRSRWDPTLLSVKDTEAARLVSREGISVRIQLLSPLGIAQWPTEFRYLEQRYSDASPARLRVPTMASFVAWKTASWAGRRAARDLFDLWLLAGLGAVTTEAANLYAGLGPTGRRPTDSLFADPVDQATWRRELAAQTRLEVGAVEALETVREAWARVAG